jgi:hypothetical protein
VSVIEPSYAVKHGNGYQPGGRPPVSTLAWRGLVLKGLISKGHFAWRLKCFCYSMSSLVTVISVSLPIAVTAYIPHAYYELCCNHHQVGTIYKNSEVSLSHYLGYHSRDPRENSFAAKPSSHQVRHRLHVHADRPITNGTSY